MSLQQINLLNPQLLTPQVAFSSRTIAWMLLGVLGLGVLLYLWALSGAQDVRSQLDETQAMRDELQARLDAIDQPGEGGLTPADKRAQTIAEAKVRLADLQSLQTALGASADAGGFSPKLRALAERGVPGVWLTRIGFDQTGFQLEGRALDVARIPDYVAVLSRQPELRSLTLNGFSVLPPEPPEADAAPVPGIAFRINPIVETER
ncbi:MAG: PilN domain-containing protein [Thiobacillus sp.]|nr:PilN domain-containing protein [Thiobacillus sp.]